MAWSPTSMATSQAECPRLKNACKIVEVAVQHVETLVAMKKK